jgi:hypothetical protein
LCALLPGCLSPHLVALESAIPITPTPTAPLEVRTRSSGVHDPLELGGGDVAFTGLEVSLGHAVATAAVAWAEAHRDLRPEGWQLLVELIEARADRAGERLTVTLGARATLRSRRGNSYLAQTQVHCHQASLTPPSKAQPVFYACLTDLGRELAGWLGGVQP